LNTRPAAAPSEQVLHVEIAEHRRGNTHGLNGEDFSVVTLESERERAPSEIVMIAS
jgi:hypothetical protein